MLKNKLSFEFNFSNRKYKMFGYEMMLVVTIIALSQLITTMFPIEEPLREFDGDYWLYMLMALVEVVLIGLMFFTGGIWFNQWRTDKNLELSIIP